MHNLFLRPSKICEKIVVSQKQIIKNNVCTDFNSFWWKCCLMFACQFDNNMFALLLFEGICQNN
jgi:hypothetical protein